MGIHDCTDVNNKALNENSGLEKTCFQARNFFCSDRDIKKRSSAELQPFVNLKSNTMKNTMQRYGLLGIMQVLCAFTCAL